MTGPLAFRSMRADDLRPVHEVNLRAFEDLARRLGYDDLTAPGLEAALGRLRRLLATDPGGAWVAERGEAAHVDFLSARQQWAIEVCLDARLELRADTGCVFTGGDVGPFTPYLPSGAYL